MLYCLIKNYLRRRLAGNLTGKSADAYSVMDSSPLLRCRLDLPATLPHDASTGREQTTLNAVSLVARRIAYARFAFRKTKSDKITFSKSNFLPLKKMKNKRFADFMGQLCRLIMKKLIFTLAVICGCLLLWGCTSFEEEECIPTATVEQTATVFNEVVARDNCDIVMCRLVKHEHATCGSAKMNVVMRYDWYEVIYSVKNFLMTGDKLVICQHIDSPLETYTPYYRTYNNSEVVYFDIDIDDAYILGPEIALTGNQYYIWMNGGPIGDLLNPARIGQEYDYTPNAREAFFRVKKSYWQKRDPNVNIHWHQGPRQTPVKSGKMEKEK